MNISIITHVDLPPFSLLYRAVGTEGEEGNFPTKFSRYIDPLSIREANYVHRILEFPTALLYSVMAIGVWSFQTGGTKFLPKNQHTQRKLWRIRLMKRHQKLDVILENKVIEKLMLSKNVNNKKCAPQLIKNGKDTDNF